MTAVAEAELLRARWRRALERQALDSIDRDDFAVRGLATRLRTPTAHLLLLPADPEGDIVAIDDQLWAWMKNFQVVEVGGHNLRLGSQEVPTAHAAAIVESYGSREPWTSYVAVHRSGAMEYGLGDQGAWERKDNEGSTVRVFNLISIVTRAWALLAFATAFHQRVVLAPPYRLTVALRGTGNALLGNLGEGWAEPREFENRVPPCEEQHLLWHLDLADWPDEEGMQRIAYCIGDRIEDAWGVTQRRYLANRGALAGRLDVRQLR